MMAGHDDKARELARSRTLNPHPGAVSDEAFAAAEFFDARDVVQVKYEMVRRVEAGGVSVSAAAGAFGFSRQSYYTAAAALADGGLQALVPAKPGPRGAHKLTGEVLDYLEGLRAADPGLRPPALAEAVTERFGIRVHPRSVERALARREAATRSTKSG
jgi:transposase